MGSWYVYIVRCADDSLYTGIAKDVRRRVDEHNDSGMVGARYTRGRQPVELVYHEAVDSRSAATRREHQIRRLSREEKKLLIGKAQR
ncbi:MAG: GIY-YIG nuclease family protein [Burkholderiales bacterium]|nr:GIY-YIG nuclease family protein [Burkholderiales bacterium]